MEEIRLPGFDGPEWRECRKLAVWEHRKVTGGTGIRQEVVTRLCGTHFTGFPDKKEWRRIRG